MQKNTFKTHFFNQKFVRELCKLPATDLAWHAMNKVTIQQTTSFIMPSLMDMYIYGPMMTNYS